MVLTVLPPAWRSISAALVWANVPDPVMFPLSTWYAVPSKESFAPLAIEIAPAYVLVLSFLPSCAAPVNLTVPALIVVEPLYRLMPASSNVPAPLFVNVVGVVVLIDVMLLFISQLPAPLKTIAIPVRRFPGLFMFALRLAVFAESF